MSALDIPLEHARVLLTAHAGARIGRPCFAGHPFKIEDEKKPFGAPATLFDEAVILGMIETGLLYVTQAGHAWPLTAPRRPFCVMMTEEGERARVRLLRSPAAIKAANDHCASAAERAA